MSAFSPYQSNEQYHYYKYVELDLTQDANTDIPLVVPSAASIRLIPESFQIDKTKVHATFQTDPGIEILSGTTASNSTLIAYTTLDDVQDESNRFVTSGSVKVTTGGNGTTDENHIFLRINQAAVGQATATRARENGIATIGSATNNGLQVGDKVRIHNVGVGYDGLQTVLSIPDTTHFIFASSGPDEPETADTNGDFGVFTAFAHILVLEAV